MKNLTIDRRLLYNQDLMLSEKLLLAIVGDCGSDGFSFSGRYLSRALNISASRITVIVKNLADHGWLSDSNATVPAGVMARRVLTLGPKAIEALKDRKVNTGGTLHDYIPVNTIDNIFRLHVKGEDHDGG